jgi:peptide/nickel transport system substrate-binding protein
MARRGGRGITRRAVLKAGLAAAAAGQAARVWAQAGRKTLIYAKNEDIGNLNPFAVNHAVFEELDNHIFEPLIRFDYEAGGFEPVLAESWGTENKGRTWVFKIRRDVRFHDGSPLTAEDVRATYDRVLTDPKAMRQRDNVKNIERMEVRDAHTFVIHAKRPQAGFLSYIQSRPPIMARAVMEQHGVEGDRAMVGTGPYRFVEYKRDEQLVLERNPQYWGQKAKIDRVVVRPMPDANARVAALMAGQVDVAVAIPPFDVKKLEGRADLRLIAIRDARIHCLFMNPIIPPLQDRRVRQAVCHAIDVDAIVKNILEGRGYKLTQLVGPTQVLTYDPAFQWHPHDPDRAKSLLAEAGYANGFDVDLYVYVSYAEYRPIALAMAEMLGKVGIRATVQTPEAGVFRSKWFKSEMPLYMVSYGNVAQDGTAFLISYFRSGESPRSKYKNPEVDRLFDEQETEFDRPKRSATLRRIMHLLKDDAAALPLYNDQYTIGVRNRVIVPKGLPNPGEYIYFWKLDIG